MKLRTRATCRPSPSIILVEPIMGENIGAAARAMKNFGLHELILVNPKDGWPNPLAETCATSHASDIIRHTKLFSTLDEALAHGKFEFVYAATARPRFLNKPFVWSRDLYHEYPMEGKEEEEGGGGVRRVALLFGRESSGLTNEEVSRANKIVTIDACPEYPVINLAQSIVIIISQLYQDHQRVLQSGATMHKKERGVQQELATQGDISSLLEALDQNLTSAGFFESQDNSKRASVLINMRNLVMRVPDLSKSEVAMIRGAVKKLNRA